MSSSADTPVSGAGRAAATRPRPRAADLVVVAGVSGSGKSTVGALLAERLAVPFLDGDSLHPDVNVAKMASGIALIDEDREPWLLRIGEVLAGHRDTGLVVACSALKRRYRDTIRSAAPEVLFLALTGSRELIEARVLARDHPFMPASLLDSQLAAFEALEPDEAGATLEVAASPDQIASTSFHILQQRDPRSR
ncbi:gluconokinase [Cnuibacter physcomitrellae]|uniref:gluconokinase n=1 Tax=Cnuibacter physcomitrellae TaxID=1619308 RepID=UPI00217573EA|nr:gluconokinase [Cnuibacter physcomitrellae]MCS5497238.1 gluconokinase [Cnuibacter physcomitrellae]